MLPLIVEVLDRDEQGVEVVPGVIDDAAMYLYRNGQCVALARALHETTQWPIVLHLQPLEGGTLLHHALVRTPEGELLDIGGVLDPLAYVDVMEGEDHFIEGPYQLLHPQLSHQELVPQEVEVARQFVPPLLELYYASMPGEGTSE